MSDGIIGKIKAVITADTSGLSAGVSSATKSLQSLTGSAETTAGAVGRVTDALKPENVAADVSTAAKSLKTLDAASQSAEKQMDDINDAIHPDEIAADAKKAKESLGGLGTEGVGSAGKMDVAFKQLAGTMALAFGTAKLVSFIKDSVKGASDLGEALNVTNEIFDDGAATIKAFAATAAVTLGQANKTALDGANTFATFGKSAGLTGDELSGFAIKFSTLASDLASFRNTSPEDAIQAIGAALRGESEPIRRYGVMLNEASLKQEALRLGIIKTTKGSMTPQQKVLAASAAIFAQTKDAQGDFARTSDGLANSSRILTAQITNLKSGMGEALLPAVQSVVGVLNPMVGIFNNMDAEGKKVISMITLMAAGGLILVRSLKMIGIETKTAAGSMTAFGAAASSMAAGLGIAMAATIAYQALNSVNDIAGKTARGLEETTIAAAALKTGVTDASSDIVGAFKKIADADKDSFGWAKAWEGFGDDIEIAGRGAAINIESLDRSFKKVLASSPDTADALLKAWKAETDALDHNSGAYSENIRQIEKYEGWLLSSTDATAAAAVLADTTTEAILGQGDAWAGTAEDIGAYIQAVLGTKFDPLRQQINDAIIATDSFANSMAKGKMGSAELENAIMAQRDKMLALQMATKGQKDALARVSPTIAVMVQGMIKAAQATGLSREKATELITELGVLEGIDPTIAFAVTMDVTQLKAQAEAIKRQIQSLQMDSFSRNLPLVKDLIDQLSVLQKVMAAIGDAPSVGSGGGGGASDAVDKVVTKEEKALETLKDKVKSLKESMKSYRESLKDALNVSLTSDMSKGTALEQTRDTLKEIRQFQHNMKRLKDRGVPADILQEVAAAGLKGGNALATDILGMTQLDFREFLSAKSEIAKIAGQTAKSVSSSIFQPKIDTAQVAVDIAKGINDIDWEGLGKLIAIGIAKLKPGELAAGFQDGKLPNGGAIINGRYLPPGLDFSGFHAKGGVTTRASLGVIGESGPEAIIPLPRLGELMGGGTSMNITINMPPGSDGDDIVRALQKYQRRKGAIPITVNNTRTF